MKIISDLEKLLINLIKIESVSGNEKIVSDYICNQLTDFRIIKQKISQNRYNIYAKKGKSNIWLVAHMDTVPGKVPIKITSDKIYGRGAVDNKGNIAGAIIATKNLENINLLFTVGEETDFIGSKKAKIDGNEKVIVMEPTGLRVKLNQCGIVVFKISTFGIQQHSSLLFTEKDNANHQMVRVLNEILDFNWNNFNIGALSGGVATNIVSSKSIVECSVRPKNNDEYKEILKELKNLRQNVTIDIVDSVPPFASPLVLDEADTEPVSFFSELSFFKKGVLFGVGNIKQAHTKNEYIKRSELNKLPKKIITLVNDLKTL